MCWNKSTIDGHRIIRRRMINVNGCNGDMSYNQLNNGRITIKHGDVTWNTKGYDGDIQKGISENNGMFYVIFIQLNMIGMCLKKTVILRRTWCFFSRFGVQIFGHILGHKSWAMHGATKWEPPDVLEGKQFSENRWTHQMEEFSLGWHSPLGCLTLSEPGELWRQETWGPLGFRSGT